MQTTNPSSRYTPTSSRRHASLQQKASSEVSAFDYEQMCLALVMIARSIQELKSVGNVAAQPERCENQ